MGRGAWWAAVHLWAGRFFTGDLGMSFNWKKPVWDLVMDHVGATVELAGLSLLLALLTAIHLATLRAIRQYSMLDNTVTFFAFIGVALPNFWYGLMLIGIFAVMLGWLPTQQMLTPGFVGNGFQWFLDHMRHLILPLIVLTTGQVAGFARYMRSQVLEVLRDDYVNTARAKGVRELRVISKHVLKNALLPVVTLLGLSLPFLLSGALITEQVFSW